MIKEIKYTNKENAYICSSCFGGYYLIDASQRKVIKSKDIGELMKFGHWEKFKDSKFHETLFRLNEIYDSPDVLIDNRLYGTIQDPIVKGKYDFTPEEAKNVSKQLNKNFNKVQK